MPEYRKENCEQQCLGHEAVATQTRLGLPEQDQACQRSSMEGRGGDKAPLLTEELKALDSYREGETALP